jgi:AAA+ ATPase superfamily predicted ATPase
MKIIGRTKEIRVLESCLESKKPEFVAVFGRRRVGKTYLIREFFHDDFAFHLIGTSGGETRVQLEYFDAAMKKYGDRGYTPAKDWRDAFGKLTQMLDAENARARRRVKRVLFFDEIAWLDTPRSGFLSALEHFWNDWGSAREDVILIICGSASSWIIKKVLRNRGGLHNRVTRRIRLEPFSLAECDDLLLDNGIDYNRQAIAESYMVFGGIPFYFSLFERGLSVAQNVDALCFIAGAALENEFEELYASLFRHSEKHVVVVRALGKHRCGLTRDEITKQTDIGSGGGLTEVLEELEQSGFITQITDISKKPVKSLYLLVDFFSLFYLKFMSAKARDRTFWSNLQGKGRFYDWRGHAFERLCLLHLDQIKDRLGILGISTTNSVWSCLEGDARTQIDLVIDRSDGIIDLCELKFTEDEFVISKTYAEKLEERKRVFLRRMRAKKSVHLVLLASAGLKKNAHSHLIQSALTLDDLWDRR